MLQKAHPKQEDEEKVGLLTPRSLPNTYLSVNPHLSGQGLECGLSEDSLGKVTSLPCALFLRDAFLIGPKFILEANRLYIEICSFTALKNFFYSQQHKTVLF